MIAQASNIEQFFSTLYGQDAPGWLVIWTKQDKLSRWYETHNIPEVAARCRELAGSFDVYYGIGLQGQRLASNQRGKADGVIAIPGLWLDIDCQGGTHTATNLPTFEEARDFMAAFPLPPSIVVHSGGGLHVYWLFRQLWTFSETDPPRIRAGHKKAADLVARFQQAFIALAGARGWRLDNTSDLSRVLRVPGTFNHKSGQPVPVQVLEFEPTRRYGYKEIIQAVDELAARVPRQERKTTRREPPGDEDKPEAALILERCAFIRHCRDDAAILSEPEWYAMLTIMARTDGGRELCHELSRPYPRYSERETEDKIRHALEDAAPRTCERIRRDFGTYCQGCRERVTSPIVLGMAMPVELPDYPVEPFPVEALPDCFAPFVSQAAQALGCPPDFIGVPLLALAGAAIGTTRVIQLKPGWREGTQLYAAIVAEPGSKKSPALALAQAPLVERQQQLKVKYDREKEEYERELAQWEEEKEKAKAARKKGGNEPDTGEKPEKPVLGRTYTTDTTVEALAQIMEQNPRGIALVRDELAGWARSMNQYKAGRGADKQFYLSCWSGAPAAVDRKSKEEPIFLSRTFLTVVGCIPPDVLDELTDERQREDGFIHRILFCFPDPVPNRWTEASISEEARESVNRCFEQLWKLTHTAGEHGEPIPVVVPLSPEGKRVFLEWYESHCQEEQAPDFQAAWRGPWAKMPAHVARLALIIHVCRLVSGETTSAKVDDMSVLKAAALAHYFKSHLKRVYQRLRDEPLDRKVRQAVEWLKKHGKNGVTPRVLIAYRVAGCKDRSDAKALLETLVARNLGYWQEPPQGGRGRKAKKFFLYNIQHSTEIT
ncbi:MAG: hypothetical protein PWP72_1985 [Thermoanaerobacter sp.]|jgi:hypothetical protein|nr:hypothetical protein [Thermoanaerobacter sp.]